MIFNKTARKEIHLRLNAIEDALNADRPEDRDAAAVDFGHLIDEVEAAIGAFKLDDEGDIAIANRVAALYASII